MEKDKRKKVAVLFSGGLDSTYLIWKNLEEGNYVKPIYIEIKNNRDKVIIEKQQAELLFDEFNKKYPNQIDDINYAVSVDVLKTNSIGYPQPLIWCLSSGFSIDDTFSELQIGYLYSDSSVMTYFKEIQNLYKASLPFTGHNAKLTFPLIDNKKAKYHLVDELPDEYLELVVSCENPILDNLGIRMKLELGDRRYRFYTPCCTCNVCKKVIADDFHGSNIFRKKHEQQLLKIMKDDVDILEVKLNHKDQVIESGVEKWMAVEERT